MHRRSNPLRIAPIALAALLGAAALLCAGLWAVSALSPPPNPAALYPYVQSDCQFSVGRYSVKCSLVDSRLNLWIRINRCYYCGHTNPQHEPNCVADGAEFIWFARIESSQHSFHMPGLSVADRRVAADFGLVGWSLSISLWLLTALFGAYPVLFLFGRLRQRRLRRPPNACAACGYDLTGNVSGICPECGWRLHSQSQ